MIKRTCLYILLFFFFCSCTPTLRLNVLQPAEKSIPAHVYKIGLINHSVAGKSDRVLNVLEGILTGENIGEDREGSDKALISLKEALDVSERYQVLIPAIPKAEKAGPMTTAEIHSICQQYNLDAIVALEYFDSNTNLHVLQGKRKEKVKDQTVEVTFFTAEAQLSVTTKWAVYDDSTGAVIDAHESEDYLSFTNEGATPDLAKAGLPQKRYAINQTGKLAGANYGARIAPYWITVEREYFKKGSDKLKQAAKLSQQGLWSQAIEIWKQESANPNPVIAGRANYNMAIACEKDGNLELALSYSKTARDRYSIVKAATYARILESRLRDQEKLDQQYQHK